MNIKTDLKDNVLVVTISETRLDAKLAVDFRNNITDLSKENPNIILNFDSVNFIDSSGLGAVVSILKAIGRNGKLGLCSLKETVLQTFTRTKMDKIFSIYKDTEEAIKSF